MAQSKINQNQLKFSTVPGSFIASDASNIFTILTPTTGADRIPFYDDSATAAGYLTLGTNLSITGTTLNATAGAGGYATVQEEGSGLTARSTINFIGSGITATDDAGNSRTNVTIAAFLNTLATAGVVGLAGSDVSGTLPVDKGGTGATTLTGLLQGNGTSAFTAITNSSTVGQVLKVTGASTYAWGALDLTDADAITGDLPFANLAQGSALSVLGVAGNVTADNASIAAATDNQVLRRSGTTLAFGAINLASSNAVTGVLPIANGGTGSATQNFVDLTNVQSIGGAKTFTSNITITATPSANTDAATVGWVLNNVAGFKSGSVRVATTGILTATAQTSATITLGGTTLTIDGQTMANGETVLVKDSVTGGSGGTFNNGVYTVSGIGSSVLLTRVAWMDTAAEIDGVYVLVQDGTSNVGTLWFTVSEVTTLGTDAIAFTQINTSGTIGGSAAINKVAYGSGTNTLTSTTNFHFESGQLCIGTATLETNNVLTTKGGGSTSSTFGYRHLNAGGSKVFSVADNGSIGIGAPGAATLISNTTIGGYQTFTISAGPLAADTLNLTSGGSATTGVGVTILNSGGTKSFASGNYDALSIPGDFTTTTGTGTYRALAIGGIINQSVGGTGITRGIHVNQTLTTPADYRALELTANSSHYALFTTAGKIRFDFGTPAVGDILTRDTGGEEVRIAAGTSGHVLTSNGAGTKPTWQAAAGGVTVTRAYLTGSTSSVIDLDSGTAVTDLDGANVAFTVPADLDKTFVVRNGIVLSRSGTVSRDYTLVSATGVLTLAYALTADENLMVYKIA